VSVVAEGDRVDLEKLDVNHETLWLWVRKAEVDSGQQPGLATDARATMKDLEGEVNELRRANEILKAAPTFFARELDPQPPR
jgi:transposase